MESRLTAGVDWAGDGWLAVLFENRSYAGCLLISKLSYLFEIDADLDLALIDVPIGLPEDSESLAHREEVDSLARSVTGRPSSVFPVPSRSAALAALEGESQETVAQQNESDIGKGLSSQSYHIAHGIGEVDALLRNDARLRDTVVESHPEVCFRALLGRRLEHSKDCAAGVGERLTALETQVEEPGGLIQEITSDLIGESENVEIDDVLDALVLGVTASADRGELQYLPESWQSDPEGLPMRMGFRAEEPLPELEN